MTSPPEPPPFARPPSGVRRLILLAISLVTRLMMLVAVVATFAVAVALLVLGAVETWHFLEAFWAEGHLPSHTDAFLGAIEIVDLFLLATVVQVVSLGLYQLYFDATIPLPPWLRVRHIDDLKAKLAGVVVTVLGVAFLGRAVREGSAEEVMLVGVGTAAVIAGLTYFIASGHDRH